MTPGCYEAPDANRSLVHILLQTLPGGFSLGVVRGSRAARSLPNMRPYPSSADSRRPVLRLWIRLLAAACVAAGLAAPAAAQDARGPSRQMTPEQRAQFWRNLPPEQRERMMQERQRRPDEALPRDRHRQLSPEERTQLREQIREANRDWRRGGGNGRGDRK
jgi:acyl transferase domain-containing protein